MLNIKEIEKKASDIKEQLGGTIFAFPIDEENPFSKYTVVYSIGDKLFVYPEECTIEEAAQGIVGILEGLKENGIDADYEENVRFISYEPQVNAPNVTMRRLRKNETQKPALQKGKDIIENGDDFALSARGLIKFSYLSMVEDKLPKAKKFMIEYYKLLSMRKYGKSVTAIKKEVDRMSKDQAILWIEKTYAQYTHNDSEIINIMNHIKN